MNAGQIAKFIQSYFDWTQIDRSLIPACDREAFLDWECCPLHQQAQQEQEQFKRTARAIESQFSTFHQPGQHPSVPSQDWFLRLSEVSGIPLPDKKMATWQYADAQQILEDYLAISVHTFTLIFRPKAIAVLQVHGAESLDEARAFAASVLPNADYEVRDGDTTEGRVKAFQAWTCIQAQEECLKELADLTDADLAQMCDETEEVIDRLCLLTGMYGQDHQQQLHEALGLAERLELEQIRRLIEKAREAVVQERAGGHQ